MVVITIKGKLLRAIIASIFIVLLGFSFYRYTEDIRAENRQYGTIFGISELDGVTVSAFLVSSNDKKNIELFDIGKGSVTKSVPVNDIVLTEAQKILKGITGMYLKANALPEKGCIIKIPFEPDIKVKNHWLNDYNINSIDKMFIIFHDEGTPYLLVLDSKERPYLFYFKGDTDKLMKSLKFKLN